MALMVKMARAGGGLTIGMAEIFARWMETGELIEVLAPFCPQLPGFFLFYPSRHHLPLKLRAPVDHVREWRARHRDATSRSDDTDGAAPS